MFNIFRNKYDMNNIMYIFVCNILKDICMKKVIYTLLIVLVSSIVVNGQNCNKIKIQNNNDIYKIDSMIINSPNHIQIVKYNYNNIDNIVYEIESLSIIDDSTKILDSIYYVYDSLNNLSFKLFYRWDYQNNIWSSIAIMRIFYIYDSNRNLIREGIDNNNIINEWDQFSQHDYIYNANNYLICDSLMYFLMLHWQNEEKNIYNYDNNGKLITKTTYNGRGLTICEYKYINNILLYEINTSPLPYQHNISKKQYYYDLNNNIEYEIIYDTDINNNFRKRDSISFNYDINQNCILTEAYIWNENNNTYNQQTSECFEIDIFYNNMKNYTSLCGYKAKIYYKLANGINENKIIHNNISLYPNPTNNTLTITNAAKSDISIYNLLGEVVLTTKCNETNASINVSGLATGSYIVKIVSEKNVVTKKIVIGD